MMEKLIFVMLYVIIIWGVYRAITVYNPVFSVLYLIITFLGVCALLILLSLDYLAILFVLIYGGAISILIMFVIMMLDLKEIEIKVPPFVGFLKTLCLGITAFFIIFLILTENVESHIPKNFYHVDWFKAAQAKSNIQVIGTTFYNHYNFQFMFMGFILFLSMVIIISLVIRKQTRAKSQVLHKQLRETNMKMFMFK